MCRMPNMRWRRPSGDDVSTRTRCFLPQAQLVWDKLCSVWSKMCSKQWRAARALLFWCWLFVFGCLMWKNTRFVRLFAPVAFVVVCSQEHFLNSWDGGGSIQREFANVASLLVQVRQTTALDLKSVVKCWSKMWSKTPRCARLVLLVLVCWLLVVLVLKSTRFARVFAPVAVVFGR